MIDKERALRDTLSSLGSVVVAYSGGVDSAYLAWIAHDTLGDRVARRHRRQPQLSRAPPPAGARHRRPLRPPARDHPHRRARAARVPRQPGQPLLLLQARALHAPARRSPRARGAVVVDGNNADDRGDYRPGPPGGARVRRAQPARRGRSRQGRNPRAVAPRRPADLGRAGVGVPVVAHSVSSTKSPTRSCGRSSAPSRRCARSASASAASGTTTSSPASRSGATSCRARSSPRWPPRSSTRAEGGRLPLRHHRSAGLPHRQPQRRSAAAARRSRIAQGGADRGGRARRGQSRPPWRSRSSRSTCRSCPRRSKISTRSTSRSASATSTSPSISRIRPAIRCSS